MRHSKLRDILEPELLAEYEGHVRGTPSATIDALVKWLNERGAKIGRKAVWTHRKSLAVERRFPNEVADLARAIQDAGVRCRMVVSPRSKSIEIDFSGSRCKAKKTREDRSTKAV